MVWRKRTFGEGSGRGRSSLPLLTCGMADAHGPETCAVAVMKLAEEVRSEVDVGDVLATDEAEGLADKRSTHMALATCPMAAALRIEPQRAAVMPAQRHSRARPRREPLTFAEVAP